MIKMKNKSLLILTLFGFSIIMLTIPVSINIYDNDKIFNMICRSDVIIIRDDYTFDGNIGFYMKDNIGESFINGYLSTPDKQKFKINRVIKLSLQRVGDRFFFENLSGVMPQKDDECTSDNTDKKHFDMMLPPAFSSKGNKSNIDIIYQGNNKYLLSTSNTPFLYCTQNST